MDTFLSRKTLFLLFALVAILVLAACSRGNDNNKTSSNVSEGELRLALETEPETLDPHLAFLSEEWSVLKQLNRNLFWYDKDLKLVPMIAREMPTTKNGGISSDGLVYRIRLRNDARWSDGKAITAHDFEYGIKRLLDPATGSDAAVSFYDITGAEDYSSCIECARGELASLRDLVGVRAESDDTIVFTLRTRRSTFPYILSTVAAAPMREDVIESKGDAWTEPGNLLSSGPYVLKEWVPGTRLVLERNPNWWRETPKLQTVSIRIIPDFADIFSAYQSDELDAIVLAPSLQEFVDQDPAMKKQNLELPVLASLAYFFDLSQPPFDNIEVRRALSMAVDRDAFIRETQAAARPGWSWLPPGMPGHNAKLGSEWKFDVEEARSTLAEAGYPDGKGLPPIKFAYREDNARARAAAEFLTAQLKTNLNVGVALDPLPRAEYLQRLGAGDLQLLITGYAAEYADPEGFLRDLWTCQRYEGENGDQCALYSGSNFSHYANPEFDSLMLQASKETDTKRRVNLYSQAEKVLVNDAAAIFLGYETRSILVKPYVRGGSHTPLDWLPFEYFMDQVSVEG